MGTKLSMIADWITDWITDYTDLRITQIKGFADFADKLIGNQNKSRITRIADWITDYTDLVIMQIY
jgi:hypothetical protein